MKNVSDFQRVLKTLISDKKGLYELAELTGFDPFKFYQGADLSGLNLSDQDLRGLNFERANFIATNLKGVSFDDGAFNGAILEDGYEFLLDDFDFFIDDVFSANRYGLYYFGRFRESSLEKAISLTKLYYADFAGKARINPQTLRKARRSEIVSLETITAICGALLESWEEVGFDDLLGDEVEVRQPFIEFLDLLPKGGFKHISRLSFRSLYRAEILLEQKQGPLTEKRYRSTFELEKWFRENEFMAISSDGS